MLVHLIIFVLFFFLVSQFISHAQRAGALRALFVCCCDWGVGSVQLPLPHPKTGGIFTKDLGGQHVGE